MTVGIIGSGNVATVLGKMINNANHQVVQVISRNKQHARALAEELDSSYAELSGEIEEADIYIVAIADTALHHLDQVLDLGKRLVLHTAGSVSKDVLSKVSTNYGVLYPIQSMRKEVQEVSSVSFMIDGSSEETVTLIQDFAETLSDDVIIADDEQRLKFHIAAVVVSNFTNHLYSIAEDFCKKENIDFGILLPLINETTQRLNDHSPKAVQTGPAVRGDIYTMGKHLQVLSKYPDMKYLYLKISESILKMHQK
jgi:predicted short-subunit dehydrogenase-like oxidoreductase (DUF2520 family)